MNITEKLGRLEKTIKGKENEDFCIIFERFDPDAAGSAFGILHLIDQMKSNKNDEEKNIRIYGPVDTGFEDSKAVINKYDLKSSISPLEDIPENTSNVILVDAHSLNDERVSKKIRENKPLVIIDHHKSENTLRQKGKFYWVDTSVGAASTLVIELLKEKDISFNEDTKFIAVLLARGIITDTKGKIASERDKNALEWIKEFITETDLSQFDAPRSSEFLRKLGAALLYHESKNSKFVSGVGFISASTSDKLAEVADHLLDNILEGVSLLIIWGIDKNAKKVIGKGRSRDLSIDLENFLKTRFGPNSGAKLTPDGRGEGGFSINFEIPFLIPETEEETEAVIKKYIETLVFSEDSRFIKNK